MEGRKGQWGLSVVSERVSEKDVAGAFSAQVELTSSIRVRLLGVVLGTGGWQSWWHSRADVSLHAVPGPERQPPVSLRAGLGPARRLLGAASSPAGTVVRAVARWFRSHVTAMPWRQL